MDVERLVDFSANASRDLVLVEIDSAGAQRCLKAFWNVIGQPGNWEGRHSMLGFHSGAFLFLLMLIVALQLGGLTSAHAPGTPRGYKDIGARFLQVETRPHDIVGFVDNVMGDFKLTKWDELPSH